MNPEKQWIIDTRDLTRIYGDASEIRALDGVSLTVAQGEFMAIMGPSGSGKSTLLNMLGALDRPTSGQVLINGTDINTLDDNQLAELRNREIGFIFQQYNLIQRMTAQQNVELPLAISGISPSKRTDKAKKLLDQVGLGHRLTHRPNQLSGGEQQRVAIARALANNPNLLLCDELTGNLDSRTGQEIMNLLRVLNEEQGKTFVLITHDPNVGQSTNRLLRIHDGEISGEKKSI